MRGLALADHVDPLATLGAIRERGVLMTLAGGTVLRISPALTVTEAALEEGLEAVASVLADPPIKEAA